MQTETKTTNNATTTTTTTKTTTTNDDDDDDDDHRHDDDTTKTGELLKCLTVSESQRTPTDKTHSDVLDVVVAADTQTHNI